MAQNQCDCGADWDIRCVCFPVYNTGLINESFKTCPYRITNGIWFINNDGEWYNSARNGIFVFARAWFNEGDNGHSDWQELVARWQEENPTEQEDSDDDE